MGKFDPEEESVTVISVAVTVAIQDNPDESIQESGTRVEALCSGQDDLRRHKCFLLVYPNGHREDNKGYVSVKLSVATEMIYLEGTCIVSLIDSSDTSRFSQTFTIPYPTISRFYVDKYISRKRLLSDPSDLLPNGLLILRIELQLTLYPEDQNDIVPISNLNFRYHFDGRPCELVLDSPLAKRLSELSDYFRAILVTPMIEMRTGVVPIEKKEMGVFRDMAQLVMGTNIMIFYSVKHIFDMYIMADKYGIPFVIETCLCFLKLYASAHDVDKLIECVNKYKDESLKELVDKQVILVSKTNLAEEIMKTDLHVCLKQSIYNYLWMYTYSVTYVNNKIVFKNVASKYIIQEEEENYEHDFYK